MCLSYSFSVLFSNWQVSLLHKSHEEQVAEVEARSSGLVEKLAAAGKEKAAWKRRAKGLEVRLQEITYSRIAHAFSQGSPRKQTHTWETREIHAHSHVCAFAEERNAMRRVHLLLNMHWRKHSSNSYARACIDEI